MQCEAILSLLNSHPPTQLRALSSTLSWAKEGLCVSVCPYVGCVVSPQRVNGNMWTLDLSPLVSLSFIVCHQLYEHGSVAADSKSNKHQQIVRRASAVGEDQFSPGVPGSRNVLRILIIMIIFPDVANDKGQRRQGRRKTFIRVLTIILSFDLIKKYSTCAYVNFVCSNQP